MHKKQELFLRQDNIIFEGIPETINESCAELVYDILVNNLEIPDARSTIKFLRIHRVGHNKSPGLTPRLQVMTTRNHNLL